MSINLMLHQKILQPFLPLTIRAYNIQMLDEHLIRARDLVLQFTQVTSMKLLVRSQARIKITVRAMLVGHVISPLSTQGNLGSLNRIQQQQTELWIENVEIKHIIKRRA